MSTKSKPEQIKKPQTQLRLNELLGDFSVIDLAKEIGVVYTQLYAYKKDGANPTLLALEQIAEGLSKLHGKKIRIRDLLIERKQK